MSSNVFSFIQSLLSLGLTPCNFVHGNWYCSISKRKETEETVESLMHDRVANDRETVPVKASDMKETSRKRKDRRTWRLQQKLICIWIYHALYLVFFKCYNLEAVSSSLRNSFHLLNFFLSFSLNVLSSQLGLCYWYQLLQLTIVNFLWNITFFIIYFI